MTKSWINSKCDINIEFFLLIPENNSFKQILHVIWLDFIRKLIIKFQNHLKT